MTIIIGLGVWAFKAYMVVKTRTEGEILASHQSQAELGARFISDHQQRLLDRMNSLAARPDLLAAVVSRDRHAMLSLLKGLAERPELSWLFVCDPEGKVIFHLPAAPNQVGVSLAEREFMKKAQQEGVSHISSLSAEPGPRSEKAVTFITPLKDPVKGLVGFFGLQQKRSYWTDSFARMASLPGQRVFIFDQSGNVVAGGSGANEELASMNRLGRWLVSSGRPGIRVAGRLMEDPQEKEPVFISAAIAMPMNWLLITAHEYDTAMAPVLLIFRNALAFLVLLLVCLLLVTSLLHSRYAMQQEALARADQETQRLDNEVRLRTQDLRQSNQRIRELSRHLIAAQEEERKKIALDLHDEIGSHLGALSIGLRQLATGEEDNGPKLREELNRLVGLSDKLIGQIRSISYALRPTILDQLGLKAALADLCDSMQETYHLPVDFQMTGVDESRLSSQLKMTLYRFLQEGITNAIKHSGSDRLDIKLFVQEAWLRLSVSDQGRGFDVDETQRLALSAKKMGLLGMAERLELAGGRLDIASNAQGTTITALLPWGDGHDG
ncbi:MAG: ATP-binding protein [Pseudomonadota bacterium]